MKMQRWRRSARQIDENNQNMVVTDTPTKIQIKLTGGTSNEV